MSIAIEIVGTSPTIPRPPRPANNGDVSHPSEYIASGMTDEERQSLREAAQHWAGTLGGFVARNFSGDKEQAAEHMDHFLTGDGDDLSLGRNNVREIRTTVNDVGDFENTKLAQFFELVRTDFANSGVGHKQYLIKNARVGSPNYGENWFGLSEDRGKKWFYALGSFWVSYGAYAFEIDGQYIQINYRLYIYDRYNWDLGKEVSIPGGQLRHLINDGLMDDISSLTGPLGSPYFQTRSTTTGKVSEYTVNDALLGSLVESGDADAYDIVGAGYTRSVRLRVNPPPTTVSPSSSTPDNGESR